MNPISLTLLAVAAALIAYALRGIVKELVGPS